MSQSLCLKLLFLVQSTMTKNAKQPQSDAKEQRTTKKCKIAANIHYHKESQNDREREKI